MFDDFYSILNTILDFLTHISWGSVLTYMGIGAGIVFGIDQLRLSHRRPKAQLCFANGEKDITFSPHYCRHISTKYYVDPPTDCYDSSAFVRLVEKYNQKLKEENEFVLPFRLTNTGKLQLENYRVEINYDNGIQNIGVRANSSLVVQQTIENTNDMDGVSLKYNKRQIVFSPEDQLPLNQKDSKDFAVRFSPNPEFEKIELHWRISAKDFSKDGKLFVHLTPRVDELDKIHFMNCKRDVPEGGYLIEDLKPYIEKMHKLVTGKQKELN